MPFQMIPCAILCFWIRCNIPLAIALVWLSNPVTMPPMFYFTYRIGLVLLGQPVPAAEVQFTMEWLTEQLSLIWLPLLIGSVTCGLLLGGSAFFLIRLYWRWKVNRDWNRRRAKQKLVR
jgi:uncharacterized protein (DUF2062 family)